MAFYRFVLRGNEIINGKEAEIELFIHDDISWINACNRAKNCMPELVKNCYNPFKIKQEISELDYVMGLFKDPRKPNRIRRLSAISAILKRDVVKFQTDEGKMLRKICSQYEQAPTEDAESKLQKKYLKWASRVLKNNSVDQDLKV
jgi:hypothetical protein